MRRKSKLFKFTENFDSNQNRIFQKKLISSMEWSALSMRAKALYPVILIHHNQNTQEAVPGERRMAILSGLTDKTVRGALIDLEGFNGIKLERRVTGRGKVACKIKFEVSNNYDRGEYFLFYGFAIYGAIWRRLLPSARALYPVMRHFGYYDYDGRDEDEEFDIEGEDYKARDYDFCEALPEVLANYAGITKRSFYTSITDLEAHWLIEKVEPGLWKVFLRSKPSGKKWEHDI